MPFDTLTYSPLLEAARAAGIEPIPLADLEAHKIAEIAKHPPSRIGRWIENDPRQRQGFMGNLSYVLGAIGSVSIVSAFMLIYFHLLTTAMGATMLGAVALYLSWFASGIASGFVRFTFRGSPVWKESVYRNFAGVEFENVNVPPLVRDTAKLVLTAAPEAKIVIGQLVQNKIVLDPYLIVAHGDERIVIGIWDGGNIIHIAGRR